MTAPLRRESHWVPVVPEDAVGPEVRVTTAQHSAARDQDAIAGGVPSRALMRAAAFAAAADIARRFPGRLSRGVAIYAGPGNNGGDAWALAGALTAAGIVVRMHEVGAPRTPDAIAERARTVAFRALEAVTGGERLVIDGLLGTGSRGEPRAEIAEAIAAIASARALGATVIALDLPSGVHPDTGEGTIAVVADLTLCFGTVKRGVLLRRDLSGAVAVLDIGLGASVRLEDGAARLVDDRWVRGLIAPIAANAHKGSRGRIVIVGGAAGMSGAVVLAARAALRSGAGLVKVLCAPESAAVLAAAEPSVLTGPRPESASQVADAIGAWKPDVVLVGPGLGRESVVRAMVQYVADGVSCPLVLDADALNAFANDLPALAAIAGGGRTLITPHVLEAARLLGWEAARVSADPFATVEALAAALGGAALLKGVPTLVASPQSPVLVSARGTPVLATGGSGDVLGGIAATLIAQRPAWATLAQCGAAAAWIHGVAAERAGQGLPVRGLTLEDVLTALPTMWGTREPASLPPVLAELPALPA